MPQNPCLFSVQTFRALPSSFIQNQKHGMVLFAIDKCNQITLKMTQIFRKTTERDPFHSTDDSEQSNDASMFRIEPTDDVQEFIFFMYKLYYNTCRSRSHSVSDYVYQENLLDGIVIRFFFHSLKFICF